jgi:hypothetical protein
MRSVVVLLGAALLLCAAPAAAETLEQAKVRCADEAKHPETFKPGDPYVQCLSAWQARARAEERIEAAQRFAEQRREGEQRAREELAAKQAESARIAEERRREREARDAEAAAEQERQEAEIAAAETRAREENHRRQQKCGKDYMRVEVGMPFARVRECAGPFEIVGQARVDGGRVASVYDAPGGRVWVVGGKVASWVRR